MAGEQTLSQKVFTAEMPQLLYPFFLKEDNVCQKSLIVKEVKSSMKIKKKKEENVFIQIEDKSNYLSGSLGWYYCYVEDVLIMKR